MSGHDRHDEIALLAYELYERSGRIEGRDDDNWFEAERIVLARYQVIETKIARAKKQELAKPEKKALAKPRAVAKKTKAKAQP